MKNRFKVLVLLILCITMLIASGCGTKNNSTGTSTSVTSKATEVEGKQYTFRIGCSNDAWRAENLIAATNMLNEQLKAEGSKDTVSLEYEVVDGFPEIINLWMSENNLPEFIAQTGGTIYDYSLVSALADCSYVVNDEAYSSKVPKNLRDMGYMNGSYYGIIQDTEVRFVIVYKPALKKLGWSEEQIEAWKADARVGKITAKDLRELAKQVVDAGICEYGITHRPNKGADWRFTFITWNHGEIPVNDKGQVVISRKNIIEFLTYWRENVQAGVTPYNHLTDFNWDMLEGDIWPNGKSFCWYGQIASKSDIMSASGVSGEYIDENYFTIPNPIAYEGDKPVGGSNPYFYALTTASQKDEKTAEYCRRILDNVLDPELQLNASVRHTHLAITEETMEMPEYKQDKWMSDAAYMTEYMFALPSNKYLSMYANSQEFFDALQQAELEALDPKAASIEEITENLIQKMTFNMGEGNYIIVD